MIARGLINKSLPFQRQDLQWAGFSLSNKQHQFDHYLTMQIVLHQKLQDEVLLSGQRVIQYHTIIHSLFPRITFVTNSLKSQKQILS